MAEGGGEEQATDAYISTPDVFISYASQDTVVADAVVLALESHGLKCWVAPRDVTPGEFYADAIVRALNAARIFVLVLTENAVTSPHVLREVERTSAKRHPIISFRIGSVFLPPALEYFLSASHWLDASTSGIDTALPKLVEAVKHLAAGPLVAAAAHAGDSAKPIGDLFPLSPDGPRPKQRLSRPAVAFTAVIAAIVMYLVVDKLWLSKHITSERPIAAEAPAAAPAASAISEKSVAVLPFVDMSEKKDQEYFSDGLSEELIDKLAHSTDLKVIARTSSFQFKGKNEDMRTIGQKLGVANLLEGSVRTSGKTLRVTAQLIKVSDGSHVWSESYDRGMGDIFKVQDEIATAVVAALQATMTRPKSSPDARGENIEAYNAILRGRYFRRKHTKQDSERAVASFEEAIRLDPNDAVAWMELAETYNWQLDSGWMRPSEAYAQARKAIDRALALNPDFAEAHYVLAALEWNYNFDFAAAMAQLKRARELDPNMGPRNSEAYLALLNGQGDQAIGIFQLIVERDPLNTGHLSELAEAYFARDRLPEAERTSRDVLALDPSFAGAHCALGEVLLARNQPDAALTVMSEEPDEGNRLTCLPDAMWKLGRRKEADALLVGAASKYSESMAYPLAESYAMRDDKGQALKWLDRAFENREPEVSVMMKWDPLLRNLQRDPRFTALLQKLKLPEQPK